MAKGVGINYRGKTNQPDTFLSKRLRLLAGAVLLAVAGGAAIWVGWYRFAFQGSVRARATGLNVILMTLDTTRADCLGCYGHSRVRTPHIDALAERGVRFTQCTSAAPITLPSHASILTGTYPFVHRARNNGRYLPDEGNVTLAERLKAAGYVTGAEVGAFVVDAVWGLGQGFDSYRTGMEGAEGRSRFEGLTAEQSVPADNVCARALEWLGRHRSERFFLWVHFFDPHQPWKPPERFLEPYAGERFGPYWGEITFVDEQIGRLVGELPRLGLAERTLVVLTADHGEGLLEHEELTHTYYVYDGTMQVPLIFWCPPVIPGGKVVEAQVRTVDITPTVLALLGLDPIPNVQGRDLLPLLEDNAEDLDLGAYGESVSAHEAYGYARLRTYRGGGWKYIHAPRPELYDLRADPREETNLAEREPQRLEAMRNALESVIAESVPAATDAHRAEQLDAAAVERLAALGYVGGYAPLASEDELQLFHESEGADPKDHVGSHNRFLQAQAWVEANEPAQAESILRDLLTREPDNPGFRSFLADQLRKLGRFEEAAEQYRALLRLQPDNGLAHYRLGTVLGNLGQSEEGLSHLRRAVETMPEYADAHAYLALALVQSGNVQMAEEHFRRAIELDARHEDARVGLSGLLYQTGRQAEAIQVLRAGMANGRGGGKVANNLAWYLATCPEGALRNGEEAVRLAERLCQQARTEDPAILDTLAVAYAEAGRFPEAVRTARRAIDLARASQQVELATQIEARLALYIAGQAYHEPP